MPDVSGTAALDVLIGLFFLFFLLSLACSAIQELFAQAVDLRARTLAGGVRNLLGSKADANAFFEHPRVKALSKQRKILWDRRPSYIPSRVFALTLLDTLAPPADGTDNRDVVARAKGAVATLPEPAKTLLRDALEEAGERRDRLRSEIERSFDEAMDRVSGWYKRTTQIILLLIALVVVGATNADSFVIAERLWKDDALRTAVVAKATAAVAEGDQVCPGTDADTSRPDQVAKCVDAVEELGLPIGWRDGEDWDFWPKLGGLLLTAFMLSLGAPFWFDLLSKVSRLRASGPPAPPSETRDADRPATDDAPA